MNKVHISTNIFIQYTIYKRTEDMYNSMIVVFYTIHLEIYFDKSIQ